MQKSKKTKPARTKAEYTEYLNEIGTPNEDLKSNGGRIPDRAKYGDWTRKNDPIAFNVGFQEYEREGRR